MPPLRLDKIGEGDNQLLPLSEHAATDIGGFGTGDGKLVGVLCLRNGEERIEIALLCHKVFKTPPLCNVAVFHG